MDRRGLAVFFILLVPPACSAQSRFLDDAVCSWHRTDHFWAVQDGYQTMAQVSDRILSSLQGGVLSGMPSGEATLITDLRCGASGGISLEGYAFGVSANDPSLDSAPVKATKFGVQLDRNGVPLKRELKPAPFSLPTACTAPANEHTLFCNSARQAVGW